MFLGVIIVFGINGTRMRVPILCVISFPFANLRKKRKLSLSILIKAKENKSYFCTKQTTKSQICQEQLLMLHKTKSMLQNRESAASQLPFPTTPLNLTRGRGLWQHKPRHRQGHDDDASGRSQCTDRDRRGTRDEGSRWCR